MENVLEEVQGKETRKTIDKRKLLFLAVAAAAGLSLKPFMEKAHAATGDELIIGQNNEAGNTDDPDGDITRLIATINSKAGPLEEFVFRPTFEVRNVGNQTEGHHPISAIEGICPNGWGVSGHSDTGWGVVGHSESGYGVFGRVDGGTGVVGQSYSTGVGVSGSSVDGTGVTGGSKTGIGVHGSSETHTGVHGGSVYGDGIDAHSVYGAGVIGHTGEEGKEVGGPGVLGWTFNPNGVGVHGGGGETGTGVRGQSTAGIGVHAASPNGTALKVEGKSNFNGKEGDPLIIGQENSGDDSSGIGYTTGLYSTVNSGSTPAIYAALHVMNLGIKGGISPPCAVCGYCAEGIGVAGYSEKGMAVHGNGVGVPVNGETVNCVGVDGHSDYGIGVRAKSPNGTALEVDGKGYVRATVNSVSVNEIVAALSVQNLGSTSEGHHPTIAIEGSIGNGWGISGHSSMWGVVGHGGEAGVFGRSDEGRGIYGESHGNGTAVYGHSDTGFGVHGTTNGDQNSVGLRGESTNGWGVTAEGGKGGVMGGGIECGVRGTSHNGMGVIGISNNNIAVWAESANGTALWVLGKGTARAKVDSAPQADIESHLIPLPSAFTVENSGEILEPPPAHHPPIAILGMCPNGMGVSGLSDSKEGVHGRSTHGVGTVGGTVDGTGVHATAESANGTALKVDGKSRCYAKVNDWQPGTPFDLPSAFSVFNDANQLIEKPPVAIVGYAPRGTGIAGFSDDNWAVHGHSMNDAGVDGYSDNGIGVQARCGVNGTALKVDGKGVIQANVEWPGHALEVHNNAEPIAGEGWVSPISIVGMCPKGVGIVGYGSQIGVHGKTDGDGTGVNGGSNSGTGVVGESNSGTGVRASSKTGTALQVEGKGTISATVDNAVALSVSNNSENNGGAINAYSKSASAVLGGSDANVGIVGMSGAKSVPGLPGEPGLPGIEGTSQLSFGVLGMPMISPSEDFMNWYTAPDRGKGGILGYSDKGKAVVGFSDTGIGVLAISKNSPALRVEGKSSFSTVGSSDISSDKQQVKNPLVTSKSHITVTLMDIDPGKVAVSWIERTPGKGFTVHLTDKVQQKVPFTYFIVEP